MGASTHRYVIALGSNMRVGSIGGPRQVLAAALAAMREGGIEVVACSRIRTSRPLGPSLRLYANSAALAETRFPPEEMLAALQDLEARFGRKRRGARWRSRPLDLDIVLWSGGMWHSPRLVIPHPLFRDREFVTGPAAEIAPHWRDPATGLTLRQIAARAV
ncbi:2-amino-4-hydroxy-6-hydroxymethyldihydropteridine diphosphokinase [Qipengyuania sphaerica]|uniref:2-amino-4-hydroxy-6- hydroxymethyldihydropteridine diphosphokinase n=1 Tax=Qipengyuania sphaerica TaxID=2867243 RepID=UPI001C86984A|nr:2-amino-4-hydroxy-6-hydroxymethyldihydropteridine diphosphokinase [Qipengyuania sphaerica]MBX7539567.1 2-amino-4-hydroxy-6-hydroxymethyldihydropteridine diphosphokinase [Qipengyuania sphaerica]